MTVTFLHTSDLQIGMTRKFLDPDAQSRFDQSRIDAISRLGEVANEHECEFIVMAGDVFEHNALSSRTFGRAVEAMKNLPVPVFILSGNHDPLVADSQLLRMEEVSGVRVIKDSTPLPFEAADGTTVEIVGAPLKSKYATHDLVAAALEPLQPTDAVRVCIGHGQAVPRHNEVKPDLIDLDVVEDALNRGVIDYLALGDTHSTQPVGSSNKAWFSGAPETTDFHELATGGGENNSGNALVVTISKTSASNAAVEVEQVPVGAWTFEAPVEEISSREDAEMFISKLEEYPHKHTTVVKYALVGTVDVATSEYMQQEMARLEPVFGALYERERLMDLHLEPTDEDLAALGLSGFFNSALEELVGEAASGADTATATVSDVAAQIEQAHARTTGGDVSDVDDHVRDLTEDQKQQRAARDAINLLFRLSKER